MLITKRDGSKEEYKFQKILNAVKAAFNECSQDEKFDEKVAPKLTKYFEGFPDEDQEEELIVDEIHDKVEQFLIKNNYYDVVKVYILHRFKKAVDKSHYDELVQNIYKKLTASEVKNQNANLDERSFGGRIGEASRYVVKDFALKYCMSKKARNNHLNNEIYIHDLDSYAVGMHNCLTIPFDDLLKTGFNTRQVDIRPANSINTAFQLIAVIFQIQSLQQFGGVAASHIDWSMVPYVKKSFLKHYKNGLEFIDELSEQEIINLGLNDELSIDDEKYKVREKVYKYALKLTTKELKQAVEGMYHNLNSLQSRSGNQLPFTSINYGTCTLTEGRMVTHALLEGSINGVGKFHKTPIFPCGIFQYMKGVNDKEGTPNYDLYKLALESTSKRLYPNYANVDWSGNAGYDINDPKTYFSTMGKRKLQLIEKIS